MSTFPPGTEMPVDVSSAAMQRAGPMWVQPVQPRWPGVHLPMERPTAEVDLGQRIRAAQDRGEPLGAKVQRSLEAGLAADLSEVRVHTDGEADRLSRSVQATAFTTGSDIFFRQGAYEPSSSSGMRLLAHEAAHTIQQSQGAVDGTPHPGGVSISDPSDRFEQAAEAAAQQAVAQAGSSIQRTDTEQAGRSANLPASGAGNEHRRLEDGTSAEPRVQRIVQPGSETHLLPIQRDIGPGDTLPNFEALTKRRIAEQIPTSVDPARALDDAKDLIDDDDFVNTVKGTYRGEERDSATEIIRAALKEASSVKEAEKAAFAQATKVDEQPEKEEDLKKAREQKFYGDRSQFVLQFFTACEQKTRGEAEGSVGEYQAAVESALKGRTIRETAISDQQKAAFAAALKEMPFVHTILSSPTRSPQENTSAEWKGNAHLQDNIKEAKDDSWFEIRTDYDNGKLRQRVIEADDFIRLLVEPQLLEEISPPTINVHMKYEQELTFNPLMWLGPQTFRANQHGNQVHVGQDAETAIIVHEVGHYLEDKLPVQVWSDISKLILARDIQATGKPTPSTEAVWFRGLIPWEGGFAGEYPATGSYTSRAYSGGETEMMSLTVEFLSRPSDTVTMIDNDPVQTALILRSLRPAEYDRTDALRPFDKYLPQRAGWEEKNLEDVA